MEGEAAGFGCAGPGPKRQSRGASRGAGSSMAAMWLPSGQGDKSI